MADEYEQNHVHEVYQQIAGHFSATRFKAWPIVERFLQAQAPGSVGLDVGCGNGKNLTVNKDVFIVASDRSENLARIAIQHQPHSTVVADILQLPHRDAFFDFAISIAVVHHMSTPERRVEAVAEILRTQKDSRRGWDKGDPQDIMVPWVRKSKSDQGQEKTFHRYYHLYEEGELERDIEQAGGVVLESGYEKDNWWAIATPKPASTSASASAS
ncbi:tRNA (carboxymethyluridine(34)-5-O)-methyltransferase [Penicillium manginii]|uniref:tRNA (carboxymethyluridine(34)-5-O)-methyltransferase n=1 Tax=Penicillium manginii TaxID=203109 RepID=UPI0025469A60|nr:tRNA (carboxymethyluridine(34)-5-O)-methyltransferase [Penicillium manginii]KAJ5755344.1 tRNA (carboxymethyluridine(34)-5-O)-methyltransferase [Penicillium manginii]